MRVTEKWLVLIFFAVPSVVSSFGDWFGGQNDSCLAGLNLQHLGQLRIIRRNIKGRPFRVGLIVRTKTYRKEHPPHE